MRKLLALVPAGIVLTGAALAPAVRAATPTCESLAPLTLAKGKVMSAETVAAGAFTPPANLAPWLAGDPSAYKKLPAFCRVLAVARPSADSEIKFEVWMPASGWNGRFRGQGNGGFAGEIDYGSLAAAVGDGYASAGTDTGHSASGIDARWALGHPEKVIDFGYRAIHEMTQTAKAAAKAFYGREPQRSYFANCSNGGRQALMEAQRFPEDYDGILAGAPANFFTHLLTKALADAQATTLDSASYIPSSKLPALARAVNVACDAQDGVADGILNEPNKCHFDPEILLCKDGDSDRCLTAPQITALKKLYAGPIDAKGHEIFPGYLPGAEEAQGAWEPWITGSAPGKSLLFAFGTGYFSNMVYEKAEWNYKDAKIEEAVKAADEKTTKMLNATDPNLAAFKARGGKLILYHGWNDPAISALNTINYFESVVSKMGGAEMDAFARLYMAPGMLHCGGGPGPDSFGENGAADGSDAQHNMGLALEQWVEKGIAPSAIIATKKAGGDSGESVKMTRPLCPYPQVAKYKGSGDSNDAGNFACTTPSK